MSKALLVLLVAAGPLGLGSCGGMGQGGKAATAAGKLRWLSVPDIFPARVPIVKVRAKDLQDLPLGHERALAFDKQRHLGLWTLGGSADFVQPKLPEPGSEMDGGLLPPKDPCVLRQ